MSLAAMSQPAPIPIAEPVIRVLGDATARKKKRAGRCFTPFCQRRVGTGRNYCLTCKSRRWRERHPMRALYCNLRTHAKARGKSFTLTYEEWVEFCLASGYHELKGRRPDALTVDRIDPSRGYEAGNIRALSHADNSLRQDDPPDLSIPEGEDPF